MQENKEIFENMKEAMPEMKSGENHISGMIIGYILFEIRICHNSSR